MGWFFALNWPPKDEAREAAFFLLERRKLSRISLQRRPMDAEEAVSLFVFAIICSAIVYAVAVVFL